MEFTNIGCGGHHDLGGILDLDNNGIIDTKDHPLAYWELCIHALLVFLACHSPPLITTDELRRAVEGLEKGAYRSWGYYERWSVAMATILLERGVITQHELDQQLYGDERADYTQLFQVGDYVQVKSEDTRLRWRRPHLRIPGYIYGLVGKITKYVGTFDDPFLLAYRSEGPKQPLYSVSFPVKYIWHSGNCHTVPDVHTSLCEDDFLGGDCIETDIYQEWLVAYTKPKPAVEMQHHHEHEHSHCCDTVTTATDDETAAATAATGTVDAPIDEHDHDHEHGHDHHHQDREEVEHTALLREQAQYCNNNTNTPSTDATTASPGEIIGKALLQVLQVKGLLSANELQAIVEKLERNTHAMTGKDLVIRAWKDPEFKTRLLLNGDLAGKEYGIITSNPNAPTILRVVENTATTHHVLVCTLCSCYPSALLGLPPRWYKARNYRARIVREPRKVLTEFGLQLPRHVTIQVHDSTADCRYLVLPQPPLSLTAEQIQTMSIAELKPYITRDAMIGVAVL